MDRLFIGAALLHRYKGAGEASKEEIAALDLLDADIRKAAAAIGKAIRLGAMLAGSIRGMLAKSELTMSDTELTLTMNPEMAELMGVRVRQRFEALASAYGRVGLMVETG
jgi:exopolyphosphatase/guanosine-5'-triphosphate,3'-diphosphate pyrophosphatase